jgi:flavin reductase (DIM6/NTAB) family NADH-FMN oxidoreductase RutF
MRQLGAAVSVITTGCGLRRAGLTATSVTSLAMTPPSLLVSVQQSCGAIPEIRRTQQFAVNILAADQTALADVFAGRGGTTGAARFTNKDWHDGVLGVPVLASALASIECRVARIVDWHTHCVIFGTVVNAQSCATGDALMYLRGSYESLAPQPVSIAR